MHPVTLLPQRPPPSLSLGVSLSCSSLPRWLQKGPQQGASPTSVGWQGRSPDPHQQVHPTAA